MRKLLFSVAVLAGTAFDAGTALAQSRPATAVEGRVERLEGEMRAVQRKVFPGGAGQYVQPDNSPAPLQDVVPGTPASSPVADLTVRVDALENQLRSLTGAIETGQHRFDVLEGRIKTLEANAAAASTPVVVAPDPGPVRPAPVADKPVSAAKPGPDKPVPRATDPARVARLAAIERPETGDGAEDTYLYGYRLWSAKLYPEAEAQFLAVTTKYPTHKRASYAQNLLGRSYLDDGKPSLASLAFLDNYKKWPDGDRAPESLVYLAQALVTLNKPAAQVCKVYTELQRSYAAKVEADPRMKANIAKGRAASNCE